MRKKKVNQYMHWRTMAHNSTENITRAIEYSPTEILLEWYISRQAPLGQPLKSSQENSLTGYESTKSI
jgi:hypothetical protein